MIPINVSKVKLKNLIQYIKNPTIEDALYEIISYISYFNRDSFTELEYASKTKSNFLGNKSDELKKLIEEGYIVQDNKKYKIIKHPWC